MFWRFAQHYIQWFGPSSTLQRRTLPLPNWRTVIPVGSNWGWRNPHLSVVVLGRMTNSPATLKSRRPGLGFSPKVLVLSGHVTGMELRKHKQTGGQQPRFCWFPLSAAVTSELCAATAPLSASLRTLLSHVLLLACSWSEKWELSQDRHTEISQCCVAEILELLLLFSRSVMLDSFWPHGL